MTIRWPDAVLAPRAVAFDIAPRTLSAPASVSGATQVVSSGAGIWKATFADIVVTEQQQVLAFRAISALLEGRLGSILVPLCRMYQPKPDNAEALGLYDAVPHDDDAFFDDGTGYVGRVIDVQLTGTIVKGATSASIAINVAGTIEPGQHFSLGERLYRLKSVNYTSATAATITFTPPAREAASAGDNLEFDDPVCRMRLASDEEMDLALDLRRYGSPTVNFVEDL